MSVFCRWYRKGMAYLEKQIAERRAEGDTM